MRTESDVANHLAGRTYDAAGYEPDHEQLQHELHPFVVGNAGHAEEAHQSSGMGQHIVAQAVAELESHNSGLTGDADDVGQGGP